MTSAPERVGYREALANREFRALFLGRSLSTAGDYLARAALMIAVYERTESAGLMAVTFGLTMLPDLLGGPLLAGLADRYPRRTVMICSDVGRAMLLLCMAIPGMPLAGLWLLVIATRLLDTPFNGAHTATLSVALTGESFVTATSMNLQVAHLGYALGYGLSGVMVGWLGISGVLVLNAATFLGSAALIRFGVRLRPATAAETDASPWLASLRSAVVFVARHRRLRVLILFTLLIAIAPIGVTLAVPYAAQFGVDVAAAGVLMAANCTGIVVGLWAYTRWVRPASRSRLMAPLMVLTSLPFVAFVLQPGVWAGAALFAVSGAALCFWIPLGAEYTRSAPDSQRGQLAGLLFTFMRVSQGITVVLFGVLAESFAPSSVITGTGLAGLVLCALLLAAWRAATSSTRSESIRSEQPA
ncbi:Major Facilitator Superfamily protein [Kibdelosporangium aridum]|uniref:Major Facilitator Superfamily protein n=1 Tax=Kibdelosporangium aridum TaxID=2030 RepID=A0A1W2FMW2_KIBAR|nr:Major Facilitator Superfamily protein [Kibdelosporangium aridum]